MFRIPVTGGDAEHITDLKGVHYTGYYTVWFGLDPTDAPLLLRDIGTSDIYALSLEQKLLVRAVPNEWCNPAVLWRDCRDVSIAPATSQFVGKQELIRPAMAE